MTVFAQAKPPAFPACSPSSSAAKITLSPVVLSSSQSNGLIGSPGSVSVTFDCSVQFLNDSNYADNFTLMTGNLAAFDTNAAPPSGAGIMFKTNVPGIEVQLTAAQNQASNGNNGVNGNPGWVMGTINCSGYSNNWSCSPANTVTVAFTAQLVKTGPITPGTVNSINLLQFFDQDSYCSNDPCWFYGYQQSTSSAFGTLTLNSVTVSAASCKVTTSGGGTVTLPDVWQSALASSGKVAGATSFTIAVSGCNSTLNTVQTYFSSNAVDTTTGNLRNTTGAGYAGNVEVQLLDGQNGGAPINLGNTSVTSQTSATNLSGGGATLNYQAQYYATGAATAGAVKATAQFTMVYQ